MKNLAWGVKAYRNLVADTDNKITPLSRATDQAGDIAERLLKDIMQFRRANNTLSCAESPCQACFFPHLSKIMTAVKQQKQITFVLPAFPGKSPNPTKVLGPLPDAGEQCSLEFLNYLCERIGQSYAPGAKIILCSDGRVFSDMVGMREEDVSAYQYELERMIRDLNLIHLETFHLDEAYKGEDFTRMRDDLLRQYGKPLEHLQEKVRAGAAATNTDPENTEAHRMYCGITRFLVEDAIYPGQTKNRTAIQKECRIRAYQVIQRSNAWSELIANRFPHAVRLSIHPQTCGAKKLGIRLMGAESWMTPWHGVAVDTGEKFILLKRAEAEAQGAKLVYSATGRPSHYQLITN